MPPERRLREGDIVELRPGAAVPPRPWLQPGLRGRVLLADTPTHPEAPGEVTVQFGRHRPIRLHRQWLHLVSRPKSRGRPWSAPPTA
jgi:hypothetical protein